MKILKKTSGVRANSLARREKEGAKGRGIDNAGYQTIQEMHQLITSAE